MTAPNPVPDADYKGATDPSLRQLLALAHLLKMTAMMMPDEVEKAYYLLAEATEHEVVQAMQNPTGAIDFEALRQSLLDAVQAFVEAEMMQGASQLSEGHDIRIESFARLSILYGYINTIEGIFGKLEASAEKQASVMNDLFSGRLPMEVPVIIAVRLPPEGIKTND